MNVFILFSKFFSKALPKYCYIAALIDSENKSRMTFNLQHICSIFTLTIALLREVFNSLFSSINDAPFLQKHNNHNALQQEISSSSVLDSFKTCARTVMPPASQICKN